MKHVCGKNNFKFVAICTLEVVSKTETHRHDSAAQTTSDRSMLVCLTVRPSVLTFILVECPHKATLVPRARAAQSV